MNANDEAGVVARMEMLLVQVETTKKAVLAKTNEIDQLKSSRDRPVAKRAGNPALVSMQQDIDRQRAELQMVLDAVRQKEAEFGRARQREEDLQRNLELYNLEDRADEKRIDELRGRNRDLLTKLRKLQKDLLMREQETRRGDARLQEVQARGLRLKQQEEEAMKTLQLLGYSVRDLDQMRQMVDSKESDLATIEEISDMMDDAIHLMDSAVETAKLEQEVVAHSLNASEAAQNAAKQFERSPQMRLWRASGVAACAVYKAMILGRKLGKQYVEADQVRQSQVDIAARLRESDAVRGKLEDRLLQLEQSDAAARERLANVLSERDKNIRTKEELRSKLDDGSLNEAPVLKERIPQVDTRRRVAAATVKKLEQEWSRVDGEAKKKYETVDKAIEDHLKVLEWEKVEMQQVAERVAGIKAREMKVVEKRLSLEQAQLDAESEPQGMPEELRKFM